MKAIVLTYAGVKKEDAKLLKNTNVFKIATNFSAAELKPDLRLCADNIVNKCLECDTCNVVSINYDLDKDRVINGCTMPKRHSTLLHCIDWLYFQGYTNVLLIATNPKGTETFKLNYDGVNNMKECLNLYKYNDEGNFDIPTMTVKEFLMLTDEEKLLGITEKSPKKMIEKTIFTDACRYEVHTEGKNNKSVEGGNIIKSILPPEQQQRLLNGENEIVYNGLVIKKLTELTPKKAVNDDKILKQVQNDNKKVEPEKMTYQELLDYVKKNNIKAKTNKKADLIAAIKG